MYEPTPNPAQQAFARDFRPHDPARDPGFFLDRLIKRPGQLAFELCEGRRSLLGGVLLTAVLAAAAYGLLMGSFSGGAQWWAAPAKMAGGVLASALICLPSLYIFSGLAGSRLTFARTAALLIQTLATTGLLLCGLLPVLWIFSQSTSSVTFMGLLHILAWTACSAPGLSFLHRALRHHHDGPAMLFGTWSLVFMVVTFQMATFLRPLVGRPADAFLAPEKLFFLKHWITHLGHW